MRTGLIAFGVTLMAGLALAYEGPRWSKRTVALFERLSADK